MTDTTKYNPQAIESKWQAKWEQDKLYRAKVDWNKPKHYALTMLPYPSGDLHIGHWFAMTPSDARARYMRMRGYNVLFPMGFDAFGLPAENAAVQRNIHPKTWTLANIERAARCPSTVVAAALSVALSLPDDLATDLFAAAVPDRGRAIFQHAGPVFRGGHGRGRRGPGGGRRIHNPCRPNSDRGGDSWHPRPHSDRHRGPDRRRCRGRRTPPTSASHGRPPAPTAPSRPRTGRRPDCGRARKIASG